MTNVCIKCNKLYKPDRPSRTSKWCSRECYYSYRKESSPKIKCLICGIEFITSPSKIGSKTNPRKYCSTECLNKSRLNNKYRWKRGWMINHNGYKIVYQPNHPNAYKKYVFEHRLVMEKNIGRYLLSEERVHHLDGNKLNNDIKNLKLFSTESEHQKFHNAT